MKDLTGKKIIVLGATGGIGEGITRHLLQNSATVVALSRTDEKAKGLMNYVSDIQSGKFIPLTVNIDQPESEGKIIQRQLANQFGQFDGAIITIGAWGKTGIPLINITDDMWYQAIKDNLTSHFRAMRILVPLLKVSGALIHLSGLSADCPYPSAGLIGLTNAAKKSLILTLAAEQSQQGPRIYEIIIGPIRTRERIRNGIARNNWYTPRDIGEFSSDLILGNTPASDEKLHYLIER